MWTPLRKRFCVTHKKWVLPAIATRNANSFQRRRQHRHPPLRNAQGRGTHGKVTVNREVGPPVNSGDAVAVIRSVGR